MGQDSTIEGNDPLYLEAVEILKFLACVDLDFPKEHDELLIEDAVRDAKAFIARIEGHAEHAAIRGDGA